MLPLSSSEEFVPISCSSFPGSLTLSCPPIEPYRAQYGVPKQCCPSSEHSEGGACSIIRSSPDRDMWYDIISSGHRDLEPGTYHRAAMNMTLLRCRRMRSSPLSRRVYGPGLHRRVSVVHSHSEYQILGRATATAASAPQAVHHVLDASSQL